MSKGPLILSNPAETHSTGDVPVHPPKLRGIQNLMLKLTIAVAASCLLATVSLAQEWTQMADMPDVGRHHPVNFVLDGYGYVVTGTKSNASISADFYRYDPNSDTWEVLPDFPGLARSYAYGGAYGGKGYLGFGSRGPAQKDLWEYDPDTETWTQLASCPGNARQHPAFVITDDGKIFVGMGNASANYKDWWEYDIATDAWVRRADLPAAARHHPYYFNIGDTPYVGMGHGGGIYKDLWRYNRGDDTWTRMADIPDQGRVAGQQFSYADAGYVLSGDNQAHGHFPTGEFWRYDPDSDSWTELVHHPGSARWAPGSFLINGTIYMMGGLSTTGLQKTMWSFPLSDPADVDPPAADFTSRFTVSPNPVRGTSVRILDPFSELGSEPVRLLNARGQRVRNLTGSAAGLQIPTDLSSGRYFLSFSTTSGEQQTRAITIVR